ncbi:hypothetical protein AB0G67_40395 [Streptomyces sp. NPDC021056]|uniref:hypothetical protein n=1 Tax=Streptomyces sp. NPDC021056 TaxID=3155012 RepID=UPI0033CB8DE2
MTQDSTAPDPTTISYPVTNGPDIILPAPYFAPGIYLTPTVVQLAYHPAHDGQPARVDAAVTGWRHSYGVRDEINQQVTMRYQNGFTGWPTWLTEQARQHTPDDRIATITTAELAHAIDNSTPYPIELDTQLCQFMAGRLLEMLTVGKRLDHPVWQPEQEPPPRPQPEPEDPSRLAAGTEADRIVAYRSPHWMYLYCTRHTDDLGTTWTPLTSDDLPDGGLCAKCGADVLIPQDGAKA